MAIINKYAFHLVMVVIILLLIGLIGWLGDRDNTMLSIIKEQQLTIDLQHKVIEDVTGVDIPEGYQAVPKDYY